MIPWGQIQAVFLDMDGTLLDLAFDNYFWHEYVPMHFGQKNDLDTATAKQLLQSKYRSRMGTIHWYCIDFWSDELGLDILALKKSIIERVRVFPQVEEFLSDLRISGREIVLLTNAHEDGMKLKLEQASLGGYFDRIISSHTIGDIKESEPFWKKLESHFTFNRNDTLLIDDNVQVLRAAMDYGLRHLLCVNSPDSTQAPQSTGPFAAISGFGDILPIE